MTGDVLFSALGTTIKAAGSREEQYGVRYTYQLEVARGWQSGVSISLRTGCLWLPQICPKPDRFRVIVAGRRSPAVITLRG